MSDLANWKRDPCHDWDYELGICKRCFVTIGEIRRREASAWCLADDGREVKGVAAPEGRRVTSAKRVYRCTGCGALSTTHWSDFCDVCGAEVPGQTSVEAGWYIDGGDQPVRRMAEDFRTGWWIGDIE